MIRWLFLVVALFLLLLIWNAVAVSMKARKLTQKTESDDKMRPLFYAQRLAQMIHCATVSVKDGFDKEPFLELRETIRELFPVLYETSDRMIFGDDCWVYRILGKDHSHRVMLMSHHDVVRAEGDWTYPPFSGEIADGKIWGRGTVDTKGPLFAELQALEELLKSGWKPECDVYLVSSHNEELAGNGVPLVLEYFKSRGESFDWILDEGGAVIDPPMPGIHCKCAMLAVHEKGRCELRCTASDQEVHGGLSPVKNPPIVRMSNFIAAVAYRPPFVKRLHPQVDAMFRHLCPYMNFPMRIVFANLWCFGSLVVHLMPEINPQAGAMVGTQAAFSELSSQQNGTAKSCTVRAFLRCVNETDLKKDISALKCLAENYGVEIEQGDEYEYHTPADLSNPGFSYIKSCAEKSFPYAACAPFVLPAGTDARHFSEICSCVIRFAPIEIDAQQFASVHGPNENLDIAALPAAVDFYKTVLTNYKP